MTHPIESQAAALAFELHPAVAKSIFRDGWMLTVTDGDGVTHKLDQNLVLLRSSEKHMVFETRTKVKGCWVRMRARFTSRSPWVLFWIWPIMGDESMPEPSISPGPLTLEANRDPIVHPITLTGFSSYLHGQGAGITQVQFNFDHFSAEPTFPHEHSDYAPYHPNQTGGEWPYMGISFPAGIPHGQLYAVGSYGGHFLRPDGSFTAELDHPHLQADSHIHEHSDDKGWIRYTYPATPWRDRLLGFQANQDDQHYCLFRPVAQTLRRSDDEGLRMLCEAAAHVFLRQIPDSPRGTTHHLSGAERAQGRILLTGCDLFEALLPTSRELANLVGVRTLARSRKDMTAFQERQADGEPGFAHWTPGKISPSEVGIHYWGALRLQDLIEKMQGFGLAALQRWIEHAREFCFKAFRFYDLPGDRRWAVPYAVDLQGNDVTGPVSSSHFAWLAATHYPPKNPVEKDKQLEIVKLGFGMEERFRE